MPSGASVEVTQQQIDAKIEKTGEVSEEFKKEKVGSVVEKSVVKSDKTLDLKAKEEQIDELTKALDNAKQQWTIWYKYWFFERIWNSIFKSQIELLEYLRDKPYNIDTWDNLYNGFYLKFVKAFPNFNSYPYQSYMNFLTSNNLLVRLNDDPVNPSFQITPLGKEFLNYLPQYGHLK